jgi:hypothetical protein
MRNMPNIFDDSEQYGVKNFYRGIFRRIEAYLETSNVMLLEWEERTFRCQE